MALFHESEFWILIALVLAVVIAWRPAGRSIGGMLDGRIAAIRLELEEAQRLREEAETKLAEYQRKQRDAMAEAQEIVTRAQADAERIGKQAEIDLEAALKRREVQASQRIAQSEAQALSEVRSAVVDIAVEATRKLLLESLDQQRASALIDSAIQELPARLH